MTTGVGSTEPAKNLHDELQEIRERYPEDSASAVLPALRRAQEEYGWLSPDVLRAAQPATDVRAHLDEPPAHGLEVEHVVEGRDAFDVSRGQVERVCNFAKSLRWQPTSVVLLGQSQRRHYRRTRFWVLRSNLSDFSMKTRQRFHRSTSPMTVSSEPTMAIRSAT